MPNSDTTTAAHVAAGDPGGDPGAASDGAVVAVKEHIRVQGRPTTVDGVEVNGQRFLVKGTFARTAELKYPWQEELADPPHVVELLKEGPQRVDILKFWQRIPDTSVDFPYFHEWHHPAAIPVTTHDHWFTSQLNKKARNKVRKSYKLGVEVRIEPLSDELVESIIGVYNDSPVRRGKKFWHYGKDFDTVKRELLDDPTESTYVTAYLAGELIGFVKVLFYDRYARTTLILDKQSKRHVGCMNCMIDRIIQLCEERQIPYFIYSYWRRGNHGQFQRSNGFEKFSVPYYYVPLTLLGRITLALKLHHGLKGWIPERAMVWLLDQRARWYTKKFGTREFRVKKRS